ncbi:MAG: homoaconitate hydratase [Promethearchaeota archaeon]|nr:MAG: homoaconitate hydratase [Candidatus Lokiarchaeota archaeon]
MTSLKKSQYQFSKADLEELLYDYNQIPGVLPKDRPDKVSIWDETLRDGEQTPGVFLNVEEKKSIALFLDEIGTAKIAVGFPAVSPSELEIVKTINQLDLHKATVLGIARPRLSDIDACLKADLREIVIFMPISDLHLRIFKIDYAEQLEMIQDAYDYARDHGLSYNWVTEDGSRAKPDHLLKIGQLAIDNKAKSMILGDTVGILQPDSSAYLIELLKSKLNWVNSTTELGIHTHNDFGQAVANTCAAVFHGATIPHVCVNGYGERAGNAAFEEVVMNLEGMGIHTGIKLEKLTELSYLVEGIFTLPLSAHKPIVGSNAFAHESGLHINALLAHPATYEPINPAWVGQKRRIYLGKFSGSSAIINAFETKLKLSELNLPRQVIQNIVQDIKNLQEESSKEEKIVLFNQTKQLVEKLRAGISDTEFFEIAKKHAGAYLKGTWAEGNLQGDPPDGPPS